MPRYYFRLTDGKRALDNHRGIDLPGNAAARTDAVALAHDLKHGHAMSGWDWTGWFCRNRRSTWTQGRRGADR
jgi:hypothetical protein